MIKQLKRDKKKSKECTALSVAKTNLKIERIESYGGRQIYAVKRLRFHKRTKNSSFFCLDFFWSVAASMDEPQMIDIKYRFLLVI